VQAEVHSQVAGQRAAAVDPELAAKLGHARIVERKIDARFDAVLIEVEQIEVEVERVPRDLGPGLELEAEQLGLAPSEAAERLVALRLRELLEPADHLRMAEIAGVELIERVPPLTRGKSDELDRAARERPSDVAADLVAPGRIM